MEEQQADYSGYMGDVNTRIRDIEEKQRIMKDRLLLIGQNLVDTKEKTTETFLEIKKQLEELKLDMDRTKNFLESASGEFSKFARKEDLEILQKQAKMFQPLEFIKKAGREK